MVADRTVGSLILLAGAWERCRTRRASPRVGGRVCHRTLSFSVHSKCTALSQAIASSLVFYSYFLPRKAHFLLAHGHSVNSWDTT